MYIKNKIFLNITRVDCLNAPNNNKKIIISMVLICFDQLGFNLYKSMHKVQ